MRKRIRKHASRYPLLMAQVLSSYIATLTTYFHHYIMPRVSCCGRKGKVNVYRPKPFISKVYFFHRKYMPMNHSGSMPTKDVEVVRILSLQGVSESCIVRLQVLLRQWQSVGFLKGIVKCQVLPCQRSEP